MVEGSYGEIVESVAIRGFNNAAITGKWRETVKLDLWRNIRQSYGHRVMGRSRRN